jgi:hypothetical protein
MGTVMAAERETDVGTERPAPDSDYTSSRAGVGPEVESGMAEPESLKRREYDAD